MQANLGKHSYLFVVYAYLEFHTINSQCSGSPKTIEVGYKAGFFKYPESGEYGTNLECEWLLTSTVSATILYKSTDIDIKCPDDLSIYDGSTTSSPAKVTRICHDGGPINKPLDRSSGQNLFVRFKSNGTNTSGQGFTINFVSAPDLWHPQSQSDEVCGDENFFPTTTYTNGGNGNITVKFTSDNIQVESGFVAVYLESDVETTVEPTTTASPLNTTSTTEDATITIKTIDSTTISTGTTTSTITSTTTEPPSTTSPAESLRSTSTTTDASTTTKTLAFTITPETSTVSSTREITTKTTLSSTDSSTTDSHSTERQTTGSRSTTTAFFSTTTTTDSLATTTTESETTTTTVTHSTTIATETTKSTEEYATTSTTQREILSTTSESPLASARTDSSTTTSPTSTSATITTSSKVLTTTSESTTALPIADSTTTTTITTPTATAVTSSEVPTTILESLTASSTTDSTTKTTKTATTSPSSEILTTASAPPTISLTTASTQTTPTTTTPAAATLTTSSEILTATSESLTASPTTDFTTTTILSAATTTPSSEILTTTSESSTAYSTTYSATTTTTTTQTAAESSTTETPLTDPPARDAVVGFASFIAAISFIPLAVIISGIILLFILARRRGSPRKRSIKRTPSNLFAKPALTHVSNAQAMKHYGPTYKYNDGDYGGGRAKGRSHETQPRHDHNSKQKKPESDNMQLFRGQYQNHWKEYSEDFPNEQKMTSFQSVPRSHPTYNPDSSRKHPTFGAHQYERNWDDLDYTL